MALGPEGYCFQVCDYFRRVVLSLISGTPELPAIVGRGMDVFRTNISCETCVHLFLEMIARLVQEIGLRRECVSGNIIIYVRIAFIGRRWLYSKEINRGYRDAGYGR